MMSPVVAAVVGHGKPFLNVYTHLDRELSRARDSLLPTMTRVKKTGEHSRT